MWIFYRNYGLKLLTDILLGSVICSFMAFYLRFEGDLGLFAGRLPWYMLISVLCLLAAEFIWKLPLRSWRGTGILDLMTLLQAMLFFGLATSALSFFAREIVAVPRSVTAINTLLAILTLGGIRVLYRCYCERSKRGARQGWVKPKKILIVGAGDAGSLIAREMLRHPEAGLMPEGFLDDDPVKIGTRIVGLPVLGPIEALPEKVRQKGIQEVLISIPSAEGKLVRRIVELSHKAKVGYRIIPGVYEVLSGAVSISQIREVDVADLLGREQVRLDMSAISAYLSGKTILVTGAGGSIGSEIVRQVARFNPEKILLLGRGENSLFELQQDLAGLFPGVRHELIIADVQNRHKLEKIYKKHRPRVVFHAAAHKHVPLMEANADQAILNNVGGTRNVAELALEYNVEHFVNISTDKAVNPTSIMGASKRIAEMVVRQCASKARPEQHFVSVRFGNVLGSRGSVIPVFKRQIASGGPVTITHPDMRRYFMTIPEAAQLVLQAAALPDNGTVYVLDMGKPVKIKNLAEDLIQLSGLQPYEDIDIIYTGLRPGEKLFEELLTAEEGTKATAHEKIYVANQSDIGEGFTAKLEYLLKVAADGDREEIIAVIKQIVPTFGNKGPIAEDVTHAEKGAS